MTGPVPPAETNGDNNILMIWSDNWLAHIVKNPAGVLAQLNFAHPGIRESEILRRQGLPGPGARFAVESASARSLRGDARRAA